MLLSRLVVERLCKVEILFFFFGIRDGLCVLVQAPETICHAQVGCRLFISVARLLDDVNVLLETLDGCCILTQAQGFIGEPLPVPIVKLL